MFRKLRLTVFVPASVAAPPKFKRSDVPAKRSTSKERAPVLSEMLEFPRVKVLMVPSTKLKVELLVAFRLVILEESAFAPLNSNVPPPVERIAPALMLDPERVVVKAEVWETAPDPPRLLATVVAAEFASCNVAPFEMEMFPPPAEPEVPVSESVPAPMVVPPE